MIFCIENRIPGEYAVSPQEVNAKDYDDYGEGGKDANPGFI